MDLEIIRWLDQTSLATTIKELLWLFPAFEAVHVIAVSIVVGVIAVVDLRLLGFASRDTRITQLARDTLPWVWGAFLLAVVSGFIMFLTNAELYYANMYFRLKMLVLLLAGINMFVFELITARGVANWDHAVPVPVAGKLAAVFSLGLWVTAIFFGRWIGFTLNPFSDYLAMQ